MFRFGNARQVRSPTASSGTARDALEPRCERCNYASARGGQGGTTMRLFKNRIEAANELAQHLAYLKSEKPIVLGMANGGVPIADVIAHQLEAPMDVLLIERLSAPGAPNQSVGAVDEHGRISMIQSTARWH